MSRKPDRVVRKTMADGTVREYRYGATMRPSRFEAGSMGDLLTAYRRSVDWLTLSPSTQSNRNFYLRYLEEYAAMPAEAIERQHLAAVADAIHIKSGPGAANCFIKATAKVFNWAIERGAFKQVSPAAKLKRFPEQRLPAFTAADIARAEASLPEPLRRVLVLGRFIGQRRGDLVALTWGNYDGQTLRFTQQKKKRGEEPVKMVLAVHPDLKAELDAWKAELQQGKVVSLADARRPILTSFTGRAWNAHNLSVLMATHLEKAGLRVPGERGLNTHGLRKRAAAWLSEEGASVKQIQGVTGHKTLAMVQLYTESAEQERLARDAIALLPRRDRKL